MCNKLSSIQPKKFDYPNRFFGLVATSHFVGSASVVLTNRFGTGEVGVISMAAEVLHSGNLVPLQTISVILVQAIGGGARK